MLGSSAPDEFAAATAVEDGPGTRTIVLGVVALLAVLTPFGLLSYAMLPDHVSAGANAGWLDLIVANRWVIWMIRMIGLVGLLMFMFFAVYFIRSITVRIRLGHWLRRGGPFEAEVFDRAEHELEDVERLFQSLAEAELRNTELEHQLETTNEVLEDVYRRFGEVLEQKAHLEARLGLGEGKQDHPGAP
jgi:hypothetical protein